MKYYLFAVVIGLFSAHQVNSLEGAYSESASVELHRGCDAFVTMNFIYWEAMQGGMEVAMPGEGTFIDGVLIQQSISLPVDGKSPLVQDFEYKPGFQIGLGYLLGEDQWVLYSNYTWLHGSTSIFAEPPSPSVASIGGVAVPPTGIWLASNWLSNLFTNRSTTQISSKWTYKIDLLDVQISRPFYSGERFILDPIFGLRGAWIRQKLKLEALTVAVAIIDNSLGASSSFAGPTHKAHYSSRSAAVGPRAGLNGSWCLGYGFKFIGNAALSLLYTNYDVLQNVESPDSGVGYLFPLKTKLKDYNALRPNLDLSLGLRWGSYFNCRRLYFDLAALYDFNIFWDQNMIRYLADEVGSRSGSASGNLFLQGLTIQTRFDF